MKEQWPYLTNYLKDGRLEISNNRAERSIKPFVIDRKNFLFANTPKGATGSAIMFSLIQTAIENGLDPYRYLTWLMKTANTADLADPKAVQKLLPWHGGKFCVSVFRQNQEYHVFNVHDEGLFPLVNSFPAGWNGMCAACGVNAVLPCREYYFKGISLPCGRRT